MIPFTVVDVRDAESLVAEVLRSGSLEQGPMVTRFEDAFARIAGTAHAVAVNSGPAALVAALRALDLHAGDEVVLSPFTSVRMLSAILEAGVTVRFADISRDDFALDPDAAAAVIGPRTKVLLAAHLYGQTADLGKLAPLAEEHGLRLVEAAGQAIGAAFGGRPAGSHGLGCFSLDTAKNITTGDGGVVTCDDGELAARLRLLRDQGVHTGYRYGVPGHGNRMPELHAAIGLPQLAGLDGRIAARRRNARRLTIGLAGTPGLTVPCVLPGREHVWNRYTVLVGANAMLSRDELATELAARGIGTGTFYPRLAFDHDCFRGHPGLAPVSPAEFPVAAALTDQTLSLPVHPALRESDVDIVVDEVREALGA
ncbi:MAG TPA: DegT/DnrJ/EryC1/StrS family aminotransferase [Amycolatopsis sp.]|jgi:dTDP-4-amino-4,6-dideoxygalactose transaminase|nr:DegT/DnrJ/EryC1/StrS family aminotransferase [Amycolatopsis sp.]